MKKSQFFASMLLATACSPLMAQIKVGTNPGTINASAMLDIESTTKGILFPRVALTGSANAAPLAAHVEGMQVYNTATTSDVTPGNYYNDGTQWIRVITETPATTQVFGSGAPTGTCPTATTYSDTLSASPTLGRQWTCVGGTWKAYVAPSSTPFYMWGTTNDAGSAKNAWISRVGGVILQYSDKNRYTYLSNDGGIKLFRNSAAPYSQYAGYLDFSNSMVPAESYKFRVAMRTDAAFGTGGALALQTNEAARLVVSASGRIGINTPSPRETLHLRGSMLITDNTSTGDMNVGTSTKNGYYLWYDPATDVAAMAMQSDGGRANINLSKKEAVTGDKFLMFNLAGANVGSIARTALGIAYNTTSDKRLKENIKETHFSVQDLMKIKVTDYNFKSDKSKTQTTGFLAQDLYKIFPDAVTVGGADEKKDPWTVDYGKVTPLLVKAIQDQQNEIASLKAQLKDMNDLKAQLADMNDLKAEVASIKQLLGKVESVPATMSK